MLLLFGIPVFVWMKWRQSNEPVESWEDPDRALLRRAYVPPAKPPAPHNGDDRTPVGLGLEE
jgi:hypothetical protein